ncbi:hypothetical protein EVG18_27220 [Burkholderia pyrrocinia]|nr:hypothetical protein EVG18_27220 [Burkholderia pyrrocinia]
MLNARWELESTIEGPSPPFDRDYGRYFSLFLVPGSTRISSLLNQEARMNVIGARMPEDKHDTRTIAVTCSDGGRYMIVVDEATITP